MGYLWDSRITVFLHDLCVIPLAWIGSYWLRFNLETVPLDIFAHGISLLPWVMAIQASCFWVFGLYRGVWRFASLPDLARIIKSVLIGCLLIVVFFFFFSRLMNVPRSVLPLYGLLLITLLGGSRFAFRRIKDQQKVMNSGQRVLIVGAGSAGESLVRELLRDNRFNPIAFVDDAAEKFGREIHGVRVAGTTEAIPSLVKQHKIDLLLLAIPSASSQEMRRILQICAHIECSVRTLPAVQDLAAGRVTLKSLRDVRLDDLLGRTPVELDQNLLMTLIQNRIIVVTGGGGSIGSELCKQILKMRPKTLLVIDHSEYNLFELQQVLQSLNIVETEVLYYLVDIRDEVQLIKLLQQFKPYLLLHAAAYKHVPLLEPQIRSAIQNNVLGTYLVAKAAVQCGVEKFVLVSSDKAVNPSNIMGATKRAAEMICQTYKESNTTQFMIVRFGNVLGSRGSVVEIFRKQLENGGPLTVTDPNVTRYFMTIPEAALLILQAAALGRGGEVFVLDMGEPVKIRDLAAQMIQLAGKKVDEEITIQYIGLRPGEKIQEELFYEQEALESTQHPKISKTTLNSLQETQFLTLEEQLHHLMSLGDEKMLFAWLQEVVPEFKRSVYAASCS